MSSFSAMPLPARRAPTLLPLVLLLALYAGLLGATAWPVLQAWQWEYTRPASYYGHAVFVPALAGLMLWHRRAALRTVALRTTPTVLPLVIGGLAILVFAIRGHMIAVMSAAFLMTLTASIWYLLGTAWVRTAAIPLAFLWLMAPLPGPLLNDFTLNAQAISTVGATQILGMMGLSPERQGNIIQLANFSLSVDAPCSGCKLLLCLLTFSAALAYLIDGSRMRRLILFALSVPLAVAVNSLRVALVGVVGNSLGAPAAMRFHDYSGLICLALCLIVLFGTAKVLGCRTIAGQPLF